MKTLLTLLSIIGSLSKFSHCSERLPSHIRTLDDIYDDLKGFARRFPLLATLAEIGNTFEERPIYCLIIHDRSTPFEATVLLDFGTHAREWASPASAVYLIKQLLVNTRHRKFIQKIKWVIIPVMNPDGYHYSTKKIVGNSASEHRFWRKNRKPLKKTRCYGVDLNRNYPVGYETNLSIPEAECEEVFGGPEPLSELETQAMDELLSRLGYVDAYVAVHACSQSILHPFGYKTDKPEEQLMKGLLKAANKMKEAMAKVAGTKYKVQSAADLYIAGGGSDDYAFENFNIPIVFTLELGYDSDDDEKCFHPGPQEMSQLERECLAAFLALGEYLIEDIQEVHRIFDPYARKSNGGGLTNRMPNFIHCIMILNILLSK